jgi:hypothetical protein
MHQSSLLGKQNDYNQIIPQSTWMGKLDRKINVHCLVKFSAAFTYHFISKQRTSKKQTCEIVYMALTESSYIVLVCARTCTKACKHMHVCTHVCAHVHTCVHAHASEHVWLLFHCSCLRTDSMGNNLRKTSLLNLYPDEIILNVDCKSKK